MYDVCGMETKKMILARIMRAVKVSRDYRIEIDMAFDIEQFGFDTGYAAVIEQKQKTA